ncbi:uncharacterized protein TrAFT101_010484 [Trichoderma asperellum]|uniref:uncharacterized protein n=1 Tax=Trichoderma asperellum TaxID=101201 RepID=UPI003328B821|nr:hypothetical protein TrAFT101_010484 [Trichoderma asperellum]
MLTASLKQPRQCTVLALAIGQAALPAPGACAGARAGDAQVPRKSLSWCAASGSGML